MHEPRDWKNVDSTNRDIFTRYDQRDRWNNKNSPVLFIREIVIASDREGIFFFFFFRFPICTPRSISMFRSGYSVFPGFIPQKDKRFNWRWKDQRPSFAVLIVPITKRETRLLKSGKKRKVKRSRLYRGSR